MTIHIKFTILIFNYKLCDVCSIKHDPYAFIIFIYNNNLTRVIASTTGIQFNNNYYCR
jgi:hypothetical protein